LARTVPLEIIPLGGLGEFGMNLMVYRHGDDCLIVDAGMMFPGEEHLGVDVVVPDLSFLDDCGTIHGLVLTHGHEDHIGALPHVLARHDVPVYGSPFTSGLVRARQRTDRAGGSWSLRPLPCNGEQVAIGPFGIETIHVAHSIPQSKMIVLRTPVGTLLHTADFKLDPSPPDEEGSDLARLGQLGREGVLALLSDSTNAEVPGFTPGERTVGAAIDRLLAEIRHRVVVTCFSSNIQRVRLLARLAANHGRKVAVVGASLESQISVAERLGLITFPPGLRVTADRVMNLPREQALIIATGSQGEPLSALARIALGRHRHVTLEPGDRVIHSARIIPGNEKSISRMIDHMLRRGAEVVTSADAEVHVSGHPSQDELRQLLQLVRPRFLIPIHGEYRHLHAHARLGSESGLDPSAIQIAESGDLVRLDDTGVSIEDRVPVGKVFVDAALDEVEWSIIRERRRSAGDGIVVAVVAVDRDGRAAPGFPQIVTRGFVPETDGEGGLADEAAARVTAAIDQSTAEERSDETLLRARVHSELKRFLRRRTRRQPLIIPVIVEQ
jgi:ribonuclease J